MLWRCWFCGKKGIPPIKNCKKTEWWGAGMVIYLERGIRSSWCHCHSLSLASVKSRLVLPLWFWLTRVVPDKGPLNGYVRVCVCGPSVSVRCVLMLWMYSAAPPHDRKPVDGTRSHRQRAVQLLPAAPRTLSLHRRRQPWSSLPGVPATASQPPARYHKWIVSTN